MWLYALGNVVSKLNIIPRQHLSWQTPYFKWFGIQYNFHNQTLLPFGYLVMAHIPLFNET